MNHLWGGLSRYGPQWAQTIRFRLTVTYSAILFGLGGFAVGVIYVAVRERLLSRSSSKAAPALMIRLDDGELHPLDILTRAQFRHAVNAQTLDTLRQYSLTALLALLVASLVIGWWLSGRLLAPVARITAEARVITATDLSRRIRLDGPDDELKRLSDTIDAMLDRLDEAFTAQRQMMDDASHELRNPLAIIRANVDAVLARPDVSAEDRARAAAVVDRAADRMARLVDDLLATSRRAAPAFVEGDLDLAALGREALEEQAVVAEAAGVSLTAALSDGVPVVGDRDALRRAVGNLLSNAVRFSPAGSDVLLAGGRQGPWAWLAVRDRGPGIDPQDHRRIFDRFSRVVARRARHDGHAGHAGLGLAIVRQIVESHGGAVAVHSVPGEGSTFVLWLPVRDAAGASGALPAPTAVDPLEVRTPAASR
ncbi:signal transduction histidine kinase [Motilibacter rhizosphaerae]|uniref:histidine kinase n=1 Tax=Motilibacter rhizosphaerae TaxID=598652 RepID=A0A4Q7NRH9_9ACTN|nr:HAMP domain-containing sensor histidine kinase [Motilibacter rhizosphaerae]RZS89676.1 signal transduction histidine kinase [Motilibacter rhizosphaerae]